MDGHLLKLKFKYAVSSNHKKKKKTFEVIYFTCNESKIYENLTFWNQLKEKNTWNKEILFHHIHFFF